MTSAVLLSCPNGSSVTPKFRRNGVPRIVNLIASGRHPLLRRGNSFSQLSMERSLRISTGVCEEDLRCLESAASTSATARAFHCGDALSSKTTQDKLNAVVSRPAKRLFSWNYSSKLNQWVLQPGVTRQEYRLCSAQLHVTIHLQLWCLWHWRQRVLETVPCHPGSRQSDCAHWRSSRKRAKAGTRPTCEVHESGLAATGWGPGLQSRDALCSGIFWEYNPPWQNLLLPQRSPTCE